MLYNTMLFEKINYQEEHENCTMIAQNRNWYYWQF